MKREPPQQRQASAMPHEGIQRLQSLEDVKAVMLTEGRHLGFGSLFWLLGAAFIGLLGVFWTACAKELLSRRVGREQHGG